MRLQMLTVAVPLGELTNVMEARERKGCLQEKRQSPHGAESRGTSGGLSQPPYFTVHFPDE